MDTSSIENVIETKFYAINKVFGTLPLYAVVYEVNDSFVTSYFRSSYIYDFKEYFEKSIGIIGGENIENNSYRGDSGSDILSMNLSIIDDTYYFYLVFNNPTDSTQYIDINPIYVDTNSGTSTAVSIGLLIFFHYPNGSYTMIENAFSSRGGFNVAVPTASNSRDLSHTNDNIIYPTNNSFGQVTLIKKNNYVIGPSSYNSTFTNALGSWIENNHTPYDENSPYSTGGDTPDPDDGGDGEFDYTDDVIDIPDLPSVSVTDSGMVSLYAPTETQLKSLADYLWSDLFSLETFKKIFNNPMDAILGLYLLPVNVGTGAAKEITVGNIVTTVSCNTVTTQFVAVDCGTFTFNKSAFTNSFLDWSPYTKVYLYLPFIGTQEISVDEFMGTTMHVVYHVDVLTGAMICYVANNVQGVLYEYMGQCAENVPLSSTSYSNTVGSILNAAASIGGVVATAVTGGAAAPVALGMLAGASSATAQAASSLKPSVSHSGNIGGGAGMMGVKYPYLIFVTPRTSIPQSQYKYTGTPSNKVVTLSSLQGSGFNQIEAINLSVAGATDTECAEIENTLKAGVIL